MSLSTCARLGAGAVLTGVLVLTAPLAASAHVHVEPETARAGAATADLLFTVPNESATATTTRVLVSLPTAFTYRTVEPGALAGWTVRVLRSDDGGTTVRWTATGDGIGEGESVQLPLTIGRVPDTGSIALPVRQTYSDGTVVDWDEPVPASGEEPEHPAPTLYIGDPAPADHDDDDAAETATLSAEAPADGSGAAALVLAGSALAVSVAAVVLGALALVRTGRRTRP